MPREHTLRTTALAGVLPWGSWDADGVQFAGTPERVRAGTGPRAKSLVPPKSVSQDPLPERGSGHPCIRAQEGAAAASGWFQGHSVRVSLPRRAHPGRRVFTLR